MSMDCVSSLDFATKSLHLGKGVEGGGGGGDEDIETRSLKFLQPPSLVVQFFRSPPLNIFIPPPLSY